MSFSILILTLNEEQNLPACLESIRGCDDIVVLDSFSNDRTLEIAEQAGCRVFHNRFENFAAQRNWALDNVEFRHRWVFHLDADERFTPELLKECDEAAARDEFSGYMVAGKMMFMDRWLKWSAAYPVYQMRLMKVGEVRFVQSGHGQREGEARRGLGFLRAAYLHYSFSKGMDDWREKHARYAESEAREIIAGDFNRGGATVGLVAQRRRLKAFARRLPFRPLLRFVYMYFLKLGFLDGLPGFKYCLLMSSFESMINEKIKALR